ncbi:hypothetical protein ElyMa_005517700 [Elysia marginata]|uniref:Uncharacterized protein n=1 Tax=Elysia marginata TaxID=1093978 RepID=A0AAV4EWT1_9GAST|nr:hypothetical protein ElyMa_005517700 [Elysia marginata]
MKSLLRCHLTCAINWLRSRRLSVPGSGRCSYVRSSFMTVQWGYRRSPDDLPLPGLGEERRPPGKDWNSLVKVREVVTGLPPFSHAQLSNSAALPKLKQIALVKV